MSIFIDLILSITHNGVREFRTAGPTKPHIGI